MSTVVTKKVICDGCGKEITGAERVPNPAMLTAGDFTMRLEIWDGHSKGYADLCQECFNRILEQALKSRPIPIEKEE